MRLPTILLAALISVSPIFTGASAGDSTNAAASILASAPQWYLDDIEFLTRDGGRWVASNTEYQSEDEPMEAYVLEWKNGYANSMTGRLYGVVNGEPTGDFAALESFTRDRVSANGKTRAAAHVYA